MLAALVLGLLAAGPGDAARGRALFHDPGLGRNGVACAACHSTAANEARDGDGLLRAGHSLYGAARRSHWRGDRDRSTHPTLADAVDVCVQVYLGSPPLQGPARAALTAYLSALAQGPQPPLVLHPALEADRDYARERYMFGRPEAGRAVFFRACHGCHPRGGEGLGPAVRGTPAAEVARKVREGNGLIRGARRGTEWMPFFGRDRLSDAEVADVAAYVERLAR